MCYGGSYAKNCPFTLDSGWSDDEGDCEGNCNNAGSDLI